MKRALFLTIALLVVLAGANVASADPWKGNCHSESFTSDAGATRAYIVCFPSALRHDAPVVVYLHGCTQTADDARFGTRWDVLGEEQGFISIFPEQSTTANGSQCWNWFLPANWARDGEEPAVIAGLTTEVVDRYKADAGRVFIAGASAGGSMAGIMAATYPDVYAAVGILAAPAFAADPTGTAAYQAMGEHARPVPTIVFQGTADALVNYPTGRTSLHQWLGTNDWADDGAAGGSVASQDPDPEIVLPQEGPQPPADPDAACVPPPRSFPCIGGALGLQDHYPHTIERFGSGQTSVELWTIHGLGHAYPGGYQGPAAEQQSNAGTFTDPLGPSFTDVAFEFFMGHPMPTEEG